MNYLREINAFEKQMRRQPLSTTAQLLWYKLMQFANGLYWPGQFQIDNARLIDLLNVKSKNTLIAARKELEDQGYLEFLPGVKGKPSFYRLKSAAAMEAPEQIAFFGMEDAQAPDAFLTAIREDGDITRYFGWTDAAGQEVRETTLALFKEFAPEITPTPEDQRRVFYLIKHQEQHEDGSWTLTFPEEAKELLAHAFDIARARHAVNWNYINGIYTNFAARGIKTREDALAYEETRNAYGHF